MHNVFSVSVHPFSPSPGPSSQSRGLAEKELVLLTHGDSVTNENVAADFSVVAATEGVVVGIAHRSKPIFGVQFHPETNLTPNGPKILENFLLKVSSCLSVAVNSACFMT